MESLCTTHNRIVDVMERQLCSSHQCLAYFVTIQFLQVRKEPHHERSIPATTTQCMGQPPHNTSRQPHFLQCEHCMQTSLSGSTQHAQSMGVKQLELKEIVMDIQRCQPTATGKALQGHQVQELVSRQVQCLQASTRERTRSRVDFCDGIVVEVEFLMKEHGVGSQR